MCCKVHVVEGMDTCPWVYHMRHHYVRSQRGEKLSEIYFVHLDGLGGRNSNIVDGEEDEETSETRDDNEDNRTFLSLIEQIYAHALEGSIDQEHCESA
jgi:hypothetical protein